MSVFLTKQRNPQRLSPYKESALCPFKERAEKVRRVLKIFNVQIDRHKCPSPVVYVRTTCGYVTALCRVHDVDRNTVKPYNSSRVATFVTFPTATPSPLSFAFHALSTAYIATLTDAFAGSCAVASVSVASGCLVKNSAATVHEHLEDTPPSMRSPFVVVVNDVPMKAVSKLSASPRTPLVKSAGKETNLNPTLMALEPWPGHLWVVEVLRHAGEDEVSGNISSYFALVNLCVLLYKRCSPGYIACRLHLFQTSYVHMCRTEVKKDCARECPVRTIHIEAVVHGPRHVDSRYKSRRDSRRVLL